MTNTEALLDPETRARGLQVRREVLGESYVSASYDVDHLSLPKTQMSEYVWSKIWARPGLSRKSRSIANLAMLTALNRPHEIRIHVNSAINNGCTVEEIQEALYQTVAYCGLPACIDSFRVAEEVLKERGLLK